MTTIEMLQNAIGEVQKCVIDGRSLYTDVEQSGQASVTTGEPGDLRVLTMAVGALLLLVASGMGECQEDVPYSPLRPIRKNGKTQWCCNHPTQHCG